MQFKKRLLNLLQVRENEWWLVLQLFFQQFFSGAGIALFFTAAFSLFLQKFEIAELPKVLIASAFMQWITGFIYAKIEHLFSIKKLILVVNLFIVASIFLFHLTSSYTDNVSFYFFMLVWYNVLYLLSSLDLWGLAALLFDVRQSKRLFGIISAGDIPAKFLGYTAALIIVPIIGTINLLVAAGLAVLISLIFWNKLRKSGHLEINPQHHTELKTDKKSETISDAIIRFFENKLVLNLAILSFLICSISTLVFFVFYAKIKSATNNNELLVYYVSLFMAISRGMAIVMKIFFTNRITNSLGIKKSLLISPVILLVMLLPVLFLPMFNDGERLVLFVFGALSIANDVLRSSILTPVFLTIMQPLRAQVRLRAHNIVKGVMDPFGLLFIGLMLYFMLRNGNQVDLIFLSYILLFLLIGAIAWIFIVDKEYGKMLVLALRNRYFNGNELVIDNKESLAFFVKKSIDGEASDVIFLLNLISKNSGSDTWQIINNAMHHSDDKVKIEAIKTVERMHLVNNLNEMKAIIANTSNSDLMYEAIKAIYALTMDPDYSEYIDEQNPMLMSAVIKGMLHNVNQTQRGLNYLGKWIASPYSEHRIQAAIVIADAAQHHLAKEMIKLIMDSDAEVRKVARRLAGKLKNKEIAKILIESFHLNVNDKIILNSLIENGHHSIIPIIEFIAKNKLADEQRIKLINVIGKIGGADARKSLNHMIEFDTRCRDQIITNLFSSDFKVDETNQNKYKGILNDLLNEAGQIVLNIWMLEETKMFQLLKRALELELNSKRETILNVFTFFFSSEKIKHARTAFLLNKKENIANALEIIDVTVQKDLALKFIALYDTNEIEHKSTIVSKEFNIKTFSVHEIINSVLQVDLHYNHWTKACALFEMDDVSKRNADALIKVLMKDNNDLVKETASYILEK